MKLTNSLLGDLVTEYASLRPQIYFKSSLTALARAMQDLVLADEQPYLVIANFQQEKFFRLRERRFQRMAAKSDHVYVFGVPDLESKFALANSGYETIMIPRIRTKDEDRKAAPKLTERGKQNAAKKVLCSIESQSCS